MCSVRLGCVCVLCSPFGLKVIPNAFSVFWMVMCFCALILGCPICLIACVAIWSTIGLGFLGLAVPSKSLKKMFWNCFIACVCGSGMYVIVGVCVFLLEESFF